MTAWTAASAESWLFAASKSATEIDQVPDGKSTNPCMAEQSNWSTMSVEPPRVLVVSTKSPRAQETETPPCTRSHVRWAVPVESPPQAAAEPIANKSKRFRVITPSAYMLTR